MYKFTKTELESLGFTISHEEDIAKFNSNIRNAFFSPTRKLCAKVSEVTYEDMKVTSDDTTAEIHKKETDLYFSNTNLQSINIERDMQSEGAFIGNAISKKYEIKILDKTHAYDFSNKRLKPYIGIEYNGKNIYVPFADALVTEATYDSVSKIWSIICNDDMLKLGNKTLKEIPYTPSEITLREYMKILCANVGVNISSKPFFNDDMTFYMKNYQLSSESFDKKMPNFTGEENLRTVVSQIAQASIGNAVINRNGELEIISFTNLEDTDDNIIDASSYFSFEVNKKYGPVNTIVLSRSDADNVYSEAEIQKSSSESEENTEILPDFKSLTMSNGFTIAEQKAYENHILTNGKCELKIIDNAFLDCLYSQEERVQNARKIFDYIKGFEIYEFKMEFRGNPFIDEGERICIAANAGTFHSNYMYDAIAYDGSLKVTCGCNEIEQSAIDYQKAEGIGQLIRKTQFEVDKKLGTIKSLVSEIETKQDEISESVSQISLTKDDITSIVSKSGGSNLIRNSAFYKTDNKLSNWLISENCSYEITLNEDTVCQRKLKLNKGSFIQNLELVQNEIYTFACLFKNPKHNNETQTFIKIEYDSQSAEDVIVNGSDAQSADTITISQAFEVKGVNPRLVICISSADSSQDTMEISDLRIIKGTVETPWTLHMEEIYGKSHKLDANGLVIGDIADSTGNVHGDTLHLDQDSLIFKSANNVQSEFNNEKCMAPTGEFKTVEIGNVHFVHITDSRIFIMKGDN